MAYNFESLAARLTGRNKDSRKLANNTYLARKENGNIAVELHGTDVVTYHPNGNIFFKDGGYRTVTTKARMNEFSPARISQRNGNWTISIDGVSANYANGITWDGHSWSGAGEDESETLKRVKAIKKFTDAYMVAFDAGKVPAPGPGDCWGCLMRDAKTGKSFMGSDHIADHLKEKYFVPSLLRNAIERFPVSMAAKAYISDKWAGTDNGAWARGVGFEQVKKSVYRFVKSELGIAA